MNARLSAMHRILDRPVSLAGRGLLLAGIVVLLAGAALPLWRISLVAPQYAEGLTLDMYAYQIVAGNGGQDLAEINTLNHYIGMKPIVQADFLEMKVMPFALGVFALLGLRAVVVGRIMGLVDLAVLFSYFGAFSLASFAYRLYSYGHHLDPHAPMKITPFMPVVIGSQQIANFVQTSLPLAGTFCMAGFVALLAGGAVDLDPRGAKGPAMKVRLLAVVVLLVVAGLGQPGATERDPAPPIGDPESRRPDSPTPDSRLPTPDSRQGADRTSWLVQRLAEAPAGAEIAVPAGQYHGPFVIERAVRLHGDAGAHLVGDGVTHTIAVRAADVTIDGFEISGSGLDLGKDHAAVHVTGDRAVIVNNRIHDALHGVYVRQADGVRIEGNTILGTRTVLQPIDPFSSSAKPSEGELCEVSLNQNQRGNGIHIWNSSGHVVARNTIRDTRDGVYFSFVDRTEVRDNEIEGVRYGLHYMYSDDNRFEGNVFRDNAAGAALMNSKGIVLRHNRFLANQGHRSYGILLQTVETHHAGGQRDRRQHRRRVLRERPRQSAAGQHDCSQPHRHPCLGQLRRQRVRGQPLHRQPAHGGNHRRQPDQPLGHRWARQLLGRRGHARSRS